MRPAHLSAVTTELLPIALLLLANGLVAMSDLSLLQLDRKTSASEFASRIDTWQSHAGADGLRSECVA